MIEVKQSLAHTTGNCKYYIVFIVFAPTYGRSVFCADVRPRRRDVTRGSSHRAVPADEKPPAFRQGICSVSPF